VAYLQCPECRLTVAASAYYLRGDQCPRCLTSMEPKAAIGRRPASTTPSPVPAGVLAPKPRAPHLGA
jgi:CxxC motif-containing protein